MAIGGILGNPIINKADELGIACDVVIKMIEMILDIILEAKYWHALLFLCLDHFFMMPKGKATSRKRENFQEPLNHQIWVMKVLWSSLPIGPWLQPF